VFLHWLFLLIPEQAQVQVPKPVQNMLNVNGQMIKLEQPIVEKENTIYLPLGGNFSKDWRTGSVGVI